MKKLKISVIVSVTLLLVLTAQAQQASPSLTLEMLYKQNYLRTKTIRQLKWSADGQGYTELISNSEVGGRDLVYTGIKSGEKKLVVSAADLVPAGSSEPLRISAYYWSSDHDKLLIFTNTKRVWRYNTRGDYWVYNLKSNELKKLGASLESSSLMFAKFSPDGSRVAYVSNKNIYIENLDNHEITKLTTDGGHNIVNGTFDWVYEEEFDCRDGFRWSPDGKTIAYWQSDTQGVGDFYIIDNIDSIYPTIETIRYPKAGTTNSAVRIGIIPATGGTTRWFDIPGDPRNNYLPRMDFILGSNELMVQQLNRRQNTDKVWICNASTMQVKNIYTETDQAFLDVNDGIEWLNNNSEFTWLSDKDGWKHLYLISRDGSRVKLVTPGDFDVVNVSGIDEKNGYVYFTTTLQNYTRLYLYRCNLKKPGPPEMITPPEQKGYNTYNISPDVHWAIHTFSNHVTPSRYELVSLPNHKSIRVLEDNAIAKARFDGLHLNPKEFFKVDIGNEKLDAWMIKPPDFNPSKKYPVIFYVYGEPWASTVQDSWSTGDLWHEYLSQLGYIVMSVDNRGTSVPRGREWRKCIYKKMGVLESADQAAALKQIEKMYSFVDPQRIGIWGWSGGGGSTLNAMFRYPELYSTGIAVAAISDLRLYDTVYEERYEGIPGEDDKAYAEGSPINYAKNLKGNLLLIHGTGDDNVHYQNCEMLVNELIKDGKIFSMLAYPMRTHRLSERANTSFHLRISMEDYWLKNLPAGDQ